MSHKIKEMIADNVTKRRMLWVRLLALEAMEAACIDMLDEAAEERQSIEADLDILKDEAVAFDNLPPWN